MADRLDRSQRLARKRFCRTRLRRLPPQLTRKAAAPTYRGKFSANRFSSKTAAPLPPTRTMYANAFSIRARSEVKGFQPIMPTFQGLVSEEQVNALVASHQVDLRESQAR